MTGAMGCFVALDSILKTLVASHGVGMLVTMRNVVQVVLLVALTPVLGRAMLRTRRPFLQLARGACLVATTALITLALAHLTLVQTYALTFSAPLMAALMARAALGERPTGRQWTLIALGFCGVLVALRPGSPEFGPALLYPLGMAAANALFHVLTRHARDEDPMSMVFWAAAMASVLTLAALPWTYEPLPPAALGLLAVGAVFGTLAHVLVVAALRRAPTAVVSPMIYTQIVWAAAAGFLIFGERPDLFVWIGAVIVAASGVALVRSPPASADRP
jgi:drug/metabolite transporter (DMT)-like permease